MFLSSYLLTMTCDASNPFRPIVCHTVPSGSFAVVLNNTWWSHASIALNTSSEQSTASLLLSNLSVLLTRSFENFLYRCCPPISWNEVTGSVWLGTSWLCKFFLLCCVHAVQHDNSATDCLVRAAVRRLSFPVSTAASCADKKWI